MIGKGLRSKEAIESMKKSWVVYFTAIVRVIAVITESIKSSEVVAYEDLGPKVFHNIMSKIFLRIIHIDAKRNNLYESEPYLKTELSSQSGKGMHNIQ